MQDNRNYQNYKIYVKMQDKRKYQNYKIYVKMQDKRNIIKKIQIMTKCSTNVLLLINTHLHSVSVNQ